MLTRLLLRLSSSDLFVQFRTARLGEDCFSPLEPNRSPLALTYLNSRGFSIVWWMAVFLGGLSVAPFTPTALVAIPKLRPAKWLVINLHNMDWNLYLNTFNQYTYLPKSLFCALILSVVGYSYPPLSGDWSHREWGMLPEYLSKRSRYTSRGYCFLHLVWSRCPGWFFKRWYSCWELQEMTFPLVRLPNKFAAYTHLEVNLSFWIQILFLILFLWEFYHCTAPTGADFTVLVEFIFQPYLRQAEENSLRKFFTSSDPWSLRSLSQQVCLLQCIFLSQSQQNAYAETIAVALLPFWFMELKFYSTAQISVLCGFAIFSLLLCTGKWGKKFFTDSFEHFTRLAVNH